MSGFLLYILRLIFIIVFPFALLIRGAVYAHTEYHTIPFLSIGSSVAITAFCIFLYVNIAYGYMFRKWSSRDLIKQKLVFSVVVVLIMAIHLVFFISNNNLKNSNLKKGYVELHPILRLSTSMLSKIDQKLVITDTSRKKSDYSAMGLATNENSLHFPQKDKYAYAIDLRTRGRNSIQIFLIENYYKLMGFKVLRHVGTADHLHISLYCSPHNRNNKY